MEILCTGIIVVLLYMAGTVRRISRQIEASGADREVPNITSATLNPCFSEAEIAEQSEKLAKYEEKGDQYWKQLRRLEAEELKAHAEAGNDRGSFEPSEELTGLLHDCGVLVRGIHASHECRHEMIEANISILNGEPFSNVEKAFYEDQHLLAQVNGYDAPNLWRTDSKANTRIFLSAEENSGRESRIST